MKVSSQADAFSNNFLLLRKFRIETNTVTLPTCDCCRLLCLLLVTLKVTSANSVDPDQTAPGPHCLPVCKNRFEKFAKIFSRRHKQTTFSDAVFLGALRYKQ